MLTGVIPKTVGAVAHVVLVEILDLGLLLRLVLLVLLLVQVEAVVGKVELVLEPAGLALQLGTSFDLHTLLVLDRADDELLGAGPALGADHLGLFLLSLFTLRRTPEFDHDLHGDPK